MSPDSFADPPHAYPWRALIVAVIGVVTLLVLGTWLIDATFAWRTGQDDSRYRDLPGTCYWAGDARNYMRIALNGYSSYTAWLGTPHFTELNDRSWWPLFPNVTALVIRLGGGMCSSRAVNGLAYLALIPLVQALTGERRGWRLWVLAVIPCGAWLMVGEADTFFLALSAALVWVIEWGMMCHLNDDDGRLSNSPTPQPPPHVMERGGQAPAPTNRSIFEGVDQQHHNTRENDAQRTSRGPEGPRYTPEAPSRALDGPSDNGSRARLRWAGIGVLGIGVLVGLTKPNSMALIPALGVWGIVLTIRRGRDHAATPRSRGRVVLAMLRDTNPGWVPVLGALGITLGTSWWFYQTSGTYPFYVLLIQRSLWWREFAPWDLSSFARAFHGAIEYARRDQLGMIELQRMIELASMIFGLALACSHLPPFWPSGERITIPLHWRIGILGSYVLMFSSGQSHAFERYMASNVFVVLAWYRLVFGAPGQHVIWRIWTFPGLLRWIWLLSGPVLWGLSFTLLGWNPL